MRFSQRIGKRPVKDSIQIDGIDDSLKHRLWNTVLEQFLKKIGGSYDISKYVWANFFSRPVDELPTLIMSSQFYYQGFVDSVREWFYQAEWFDIYDLIEFINELIQNNLEHLDLHFSERVNYDLEKEVSGYRLVDGKIVRLTSVEEIAAIENAIQNTDEKNPVNIHLRNALDKLSNRTNPDYRNSIKESISAVESMCKIITGDATATLGKALGEIEKRHSLHGALKSGFSALYGYTSDSGGIRHALLGDDIEIKIEDALFMLVSCSAFINYLQSKVS